MFDTYRITPSSPVVHVHNETKPHDPADAARLYGELRDRAEKEAAEAVVERLGANNEITAAVIHEATDFMKQERLARVVFKLNGVLYDFKLKWDCGMLRHEMARAVVEQLVSNMETRLQLGKDGGR